jgi:hypothetical protein
VSGDGVPTPYQPVERLHGHDGMRWISKGRFLTFGQVRGGHDVNIGGLKLIGALTALGQAKHPHLPARVGNVGKRSNEMRFCAANTERFGHDQKPLL